MEHFRVIDSGNIIGAFTRNDMINDSLLPPNNSGNLLPLAFKNSHYSSIPSLSSLSVPSPIVTTETLPPPVAPVHYIPPKESYITRKDSSYSTSANLPLNQPVDTGIKPPVQEAEWTTEELQVFGDALASNGDCWDLFWNAISSTTLARNRGMDIILERWMAVMGSKGSNSNASNPNSSSGYIFGSDHGIANRGPSWTDAEISALKRAVAKHQLKWKLIKDDPEFAPYFQGRTENSLKSKWNRVRLDGRKPVQYVGSNSFNPRASPSHSMSSACSAVSTTPQRSEQPVHPKSLHSPPYSPKSHSVQDTFGNYLPQSSHIIEGSDLNIRSHSPHIPDLKSHTIAPVNPLESYNSTPGASHNFFNQRNFESMFGGSSITNPFSQNQGFYLDSSRESAIDSGEHITSQSEGSNFRYSRDERNFKEKEHPQATLERALRHCTTYQFPLSVMDADSAIIRLGKQENTSEGRSEGGHPSSRRSDMKTAAFIKAVSHFQQAKFDLALEDCNLALQLDSTFIPAFVLRGLACINLGVAGGLKSPRFDSLAASAYADLSICLWPSLTPTNINFAFDRISAQVPMHSDSKAINKRKSKNH